MRLKGKSVSYGYSSIHVLRDLIYPMDGWVLGYQFLAHSGMQPLDAAPYGLCQCIIHVVESDYRAECRRLCQAVRSTEIWN